MSDADDETIEFYDYVNNQLCSNAIFCDNSCLKKETREAVVGKYYQTKNWKNKANFERGVNLENDTWKKNIKNLKFYSK